MSVGHKMFAPYYHKIWPAQQHKKVSLQKELQFGIFNVLVRYACICFAIFLMAKYILLLEYFSRFVTCSVFKGPPEKV